MQGKERVIPRLRVNSREYRPLKRHLLIYCLAHRLTGTNAGTTSSPSAWRLSLEIVSYARIYHRIYTRLSIVQSSLWRPNKVPILPSWLHTKWTWTPGPMPCSSPIFTIYNGGRIPPKVSIPITLTLRRILGLELICFINVVSVLIGHWFPSKQFVDSSDLIL